MADTTIRGINIQFGGDAQSFNKANKEVNKEMQLTQKESKALDKALKFDPTNVELLEKKFTATSDSVSLSTKKTKQLEDELKRLESKNVDDLQKEFEQVSKATDESKQATKQLQNELKQLQNSGVDKTSEEFKALERDIEASKLETKQLQEEMKGISNDMDKISKDPAFRKLKADIAGSQAESKRLEEELKQIDTQLEQINKEGIDIDTSGAVDGVTNLTSGLEGAIGSVDGFNSAVQGLGESAISMGGAFGVAGAAVVGVTAAFALYEVAVDKAIERQQTLNEANFALSATYADVEISSNRTEKQISNLGAAFNASSEDVLKASGVMTQYNDSLKVNESTIQDTGAILIAQQQGLIDVEDATKAADAAYRVWNLTSLEQEQLMGAQIGLMQKYGFAAEDITDTVWEWSDTFAAAGLSMEDMFNILEIGLQNGAKSTDEVANAFNEMNIAVGDSKGVIDDMDSSLQALYTTEELNAIGMDNLAKKAGLTTIEFENLVKSDPSQAFAAILANDPSATFESVIKESQELNVETGSLAETIKVMEPIMGTYGEEMLGSAYKVGELSGAQQKLIDQSPVLLEQLALQKDSLPVQEYEALEQAITDGNLAMLLYSDTGWNLLLPMLEKEAETNQVLKETMPLLTEAHNVLNTAMSDGVVQASEMASINAILSDENLPKLQEALGLTKEQVDTLKTAQEGMKLITDLQNQSTEQQINSLLGLANQTKLTAFEQQTFSIETQKATASGNNFTTSVEQMTGAEIIAKVKTGELTLEQAKLGEKFGLSKEQADVLSRSMETLKNKQSSAEDITHALNDAQTVLYESEILSSEGKDKLTAATEKTTEADRIFSKVNDDVTKSLDDSRTAAEKGNDIFNDFEQQSQKLVDQMPKSARAVDILTTSYEKNNKASQNATNQIDTYNKTNPKDKSATITYKYETKGTPPPDAAKAQTFSTPGTGEISGGRSTFGISMPSIEPAISGINATSSNITNTPISFNIGGNINALSSNSKSYIADIQEEIINVVRYELPKYL